MSFGKHFSCTTRFLPFQLKSKNISLIFFSFNEKRFLYFPFADHALFDKNFSNENYSAKILSNWAKSGIFGKLMTCTIRFPPFELNLMQFKVSYEGEKRAANLSPAPLYKPPNLTGARPPFLGLLHTVTMKHRFAD